MKQIFIKLKFLAPELDTLVWDTNIQEGELNYFR
jgi:hypothetical protein